ncbi:hypothetical protein EDD27_3487 [Nonomuraea polychroma]|uniref:Uncharacterized protein n=1 Tax=Nonomuraea polychroma TaxID=46176 RepID=A0A438M679_9ACTN|nr:hypothetical protein EDD27_3487 [Nonomuraea polychroma]
MWQKDRSGLVAASGRSQGLTSAAKIGAAALALAAAAVFGAPAFVGAQREPGGLGGGLAPGARKEPPHGLTLSGNPVQRRSAGRWLMSLNITIAGGRPVRYSMTVSAVLALFSPSHRDGGASSACRISHAIG